MFGSDLSHQPTIASFPKGFVATGWNIKFFFRIVWIVFFSSRDPKGHVSYCHHLASVVRRKLFQKYSPLKVLDQWKPSLVWIITRMCSFKIVSGGAVHQSTWPLLLKMEHMVKLQVLGNNSKTLIISKIWHGVKMSRIARSTHTAIWSKIDNPFWSYFPFFIKF